MNFKNYHLAIQLVLLLSVQSFFSLVNAQNPLAIWQTTVDSVDVFSSPRAIDLTDDGILDIVIGGGVEDQIRNQAITAIDGDSGEILWQVSAKNEIFGSAVFQDITGDRIPDVFIGGRVAEFKAIDGATGDIIWEFFPYPITVSAADSGWYNFYSPQLILDQNDDGFADLLLANGGDRSAGTLDTVRPAGNLVVLSSLDGELLAKAAVPDGRETYLSPLVHDFVGDGTFEVIFGTGGETIGGSLWRVPLADVMNGDISGATRLITSENKGFIPPPSLTDVNDDGVLDIIINAYSDRIAAINGSNNETLWMVNLPGTETNASPAIGQFTDDDIADIFTIVAVGIAPVFTDFIPIMINGASGALTYIDTLQEWSVISPIAFDYDEDGKDEVVFPANTPFSAGPPIQSQLRMIDFNDDFTTELTDFEDGSNLGSTPLVIDLDDDEILDLVYARHLTSNTPKPSSGYVLTRIDLETEVTGPIAWGGYLGTNSNGKYTAGGVVNCANFVPQFESGNVTCFGAEDGYIAVTVPSGTPPFTYWWNDVAFPPNISPNIAFQGLAPGKYTLGVADANFCQINKVFDLTEPEPIELSFDITPESEWQAEDGTITVTATGGAGDFTYYWSNGETTATIDSLYPQAYTVFVTDANGCQVTNEMDLIVTNTKEIAESQEFISIFPNPTTGLFQVHLPIVFSTKNAQLNIYTTQGQLLQQKNIDLSNPVQNIDLTDFYKGLYYISVEIDGEKWTEKVVRF